MASEAEKRMEMDINGAQNLDALCIRGFQGGSRRFNTNIYADSRKIVIKSPSGMV